MSRYETHEEHNSPYNMDEIDFSETLAESFARCTTFNERIEFNEWEFTQREHEKRLLRDYDAECKGSLIFLILNEI